MTNLSMKKADIIATLAIVLICFYVFYESGKWPVGVLIGIGSPSFIPRGVAACLLFAAGMILFRALRGRALMLESKLKGANLRRVSAAALLTGAYVFVVERVGFISTTFLYMLFFVWVLGERRWLRLIIFALLVPTVAYVIFSNILHVPLPRGWLR